MNATALNPYQLLQSIATQCYAQAAGLPQRSEAQTYWNGIGFRMGSVHFVVAMEDVSEILRAPQYTKLPGVKPWVVGVANVRGRLVPLVDMARFFAQDTQVAQHSRRIIVIEYDDTIVGLIVDGVDGMQHFPVQTFVPLNESRFSQPLQSCIKGQYPHQQNENWFVFNMGTLVTLPEFINIAN